MRKIIICLVAMTLLFSASAYAASVETVNVSEDIVRISGDAEPGSVISVLILSPGYSVSDVILSGSEAVSYCETAKAGNDGFSLDVGMYDADSEGGIYTIIISDENSEIGEEIPFRFHFANEKYDLIDKLETEEPSSLVEEFFLKNSLADSEIYQTTSLSAIKEVFAREDEFERDIDKMYDYLVDTLCIAAYKSGNEKLIESGEIEFADVIGADGTELYLDYCNNLTDEGKDKVNHKLLGGNYETTDDIHKEFDELVLLHLVCDNPEDGFGHMKGLFTKYEEEFKECGINPSKMEKVTAKNNVYKAMVNSDASTMEDLKKAYNKAIKAASDSQGSGGGGGGGGSSASAPNNSFVGGPVESSPASDGNGYVEEKKNPFADTESVQWADEAIRELYSMGIISGKSETSFAPNDTVTREEFTKMIVLAFLDESSGGENSFSDVSGWSEPYICTAASKKIVTGFEDGTFNPKGNINREQAATIIVRALYENDFYSQKIGRPFLDDADISGWAKESVETLSAEGIISGRENGIFCPKEDMTRAEAAKVIFYSMKLAGRTK